MTLGAAGAACTSTPTGYSAFSLGGRGVACCSVQAFTSLTDGRTFFLCGHFFLLLDYAVLFDTGGLRTSTGILGELLSDHFALRVDVLVSKIQNAPHRKRYRSTGDKKEELITGVQDWYTHYEPRDVDSLMIYDLLLIMWCWEIALGVQVT